LHLRLEVTYGEGCIFGADLDTGKSVASKVEKTKIKKSIKSKANINFYSSYISSGADITD
jgi:hypothetical protein